MADGKDRVEAPEAVVIVLVLHGPIARGAIAGAGMVPCSAGWRDSYRAPSATL